MCHAVDCNGGLSEEPEVARESGADQEVPRSAVLPDQTAGEFDFNEFFNLEKTMPGLASVRLSTGLWVACIMGAADWLEQDIWCGQGCVCVCVFVCEPLGCGAVG